MLDSKIVWICILSAHPSVEDIISSQLNEFHPTKQVAKGEKGKGPSGWEIFQNKWPTWTKAQGKRIMLVSRVQRGTQSSGREVGSRGLEKKAVLYKENFSGQWVAIWPSCRPSVPFLVLQQSTNYMHDIDFPLRVPHLTFCTVSPSSAITDKPAEFSIYYLVSKAFPSLLPLCNSISLMLTAKMTWGPGVDSTSESGALKSVPAMWKCVGRCDNDLSVAHLLEHVKAPNKNNSHL